VLVLVTMQYIRLLLSAAVYRYISIVYIFCVLVQEIAHNRGVCYMYLKDPEKVCKFLHVMFSNELWLTVILV